MTTRTLTTTRTIPHQQKPSAIDRIGLAAVKKHLGQLKHGRLTVELPDGDRLTFGAAGAKLSGHLQVNSWGFFRRVLMNADIGFGESYTEGEWDSPDLTAVLRVFAANMHAADERKNIAFSALGRIADRIRHALNKNDLTGSRKNIEYHYDLGNEFYRLFLDQTLTYSCALFTHAEETLEEGQINKIEALLARAQVKPGDHVLEIGSGWGTLALHAARHHGCTVTTITLSKEQYNEVKRRAHEEHLEDRVIPMLCDYRKITGKFDKIISVEMLEAVGHEYFGTFFKTVDRLLKPDGVASIQVITIPDERYDRYRRATDWIQKYIFPGAVVPSLTALNKAMTSNSRLMVDELENIGIHYARTLREWREAFEKRIDDVKKLGFDERFCRMWRYYLCYCEAGFEERELGVLQLRLTRSNNTSLSVYR